MSGDSFFTDAKLWYKVFPRPSNSSIFTSRWLVEAPTERWCSCAFVLDVTRVATSFFNTTIASLTSFSVARCEPQFSISSCASAEFCSSHAASFTQLGTLYSLWDLLCKPFFKNVTRWWRFIHCKTCPFLRSIIPVVGHFTQVFQSVGWFSSLTFPSLPNTAKRSKQFLIP